MNGGILNGSASASSATGKIYVDGATSRGRLSGAYIRDGGVVFDIAAGIRAFSNNLKHSDLAGDSAIDGGLTKNGAGYLSVGIVTYTGPTTVNDGRLAGSGFSDLTINAGGIFEAPGSSTFSIGRNLTLALEGIIDLDLRGQGTFGGILTLGGSLNVLPTIGNLQLDRKFYVFRGLDSAIVEGEFSNAPDGMLTDIIGNVYRLNYADRDPNDATSALFNDVSLQVIVSVPEPSPAALVLLAGGLLILRKSRRCRTRRVH